MSPAPDPKARPALTALLIDPYDTDYQLLHELFQRFRWTLFTAESPHRALTCLRRNQVHVVITSSERPHWNWKRVVEDVRGITPVPLVVVTSRTADDYLWAEVLNVGGFDLLARPFDQNEVERVLTSARLHFDPQSHRAGRVA